MTRRILADAARLPTAVTTMTQATPPNDFVMQLITAPLTAIVTHYASCLLANAKAMAFLAEALHITPEQAAQSAIGFSDRSLGTLIPPKTVKQGREIRNLLIDLGVYKANGRETLRGYVTVPILDEGGVIVGIRGHKVDRHSQGDSVVMVGKGSLTTDITEDTDGNFDTARRERFGDAGIGLATEDTKGTKIDFQDVAPESVSGTALAAGLDTSPVRSTEPTANVLSINDGQICFQCDDRLYRIRGLEKNTSSTTLKVNLMVSRDSLVHLDSLDLVKSRSRASFVKAAAGELFVDADTIKKDIGRLLLQLETLQAGRIDELKKPKTVAVKLTDDEEREALSLLRDPDLLPRIVADFDTCGIVGESTGKLAGYLAATSRKLKHPLAIVIQSSSSAGKTSLMDAILGMMPPEDVQRYSGMTGRSLFYLDSDSIRHKILAISEDEGASDASYALKLLQSDGELRHATVGRGENGKVQTQEHHVEGPVQIFLTTTAMQVDEELVNRCLVLAVDETSPQTEAILSRQRDAHTVNVKQADFVREAIRKLHQNAQRLLKPLHVFNPFAPQLTFPSHKTRMRRDQLKYLTLIDTIAFLHQHQREIHRHVIGETEIQYVNVQRNDIAVANGIAGEVLGRSLDELSPQTRNLLSLLNDHVNKQSQISRVPRDAFRFTRRDVRDAVHWSDSQISTHLNRLVGLEYVLAHRGRNGQKYVYELLYQGEGFEGQPFLMGLIDPSKLRHPASMPKTLTPSR